MASVDNVTCLLQDLARRLPERVALAEASGRTITFERLDSATASLAGALRREGFGPGHRFLVLVPMGISLYLALLSLFRAGCTAVLVDPGMSRARLGPLLGGLGLSGFIGSPRAQLLRLALPQLRGLDMYLSTGFSFLPHRLLCSFRGPPAEPVPSQEPALVTFTGGSTGTPRALGRDHAFLLAQHEVLATHMGLCQSDVDLPTLPVFLLNSLALGATCLLPPAHPTQLREKATIALLSRMAGAGVTTSSGSPAFFGSLVDVAESRGLALPNFRKLFLGGGRVPSVLLERLARLLPSTRLQIVYGSTEAEPIASVDARQVLEAGGDAAGRGSLVGRPVRGIRLRLWKPGTSQEVPEGHAGEVVVSGAHVNTHYLDDAGAEARFKVRKDGDTWHRTGDLARLDSAGRLWLLGRVGEDIAGFYPLQVEGLAESLPFVRRAALWNLGEGDSGQELPAMVVELRRRKLPDAWREQLRSTTGLDEIIQLPAIPMDPRHGAKVDRWKLHAVLGARGHLSGPSREPEGESES